MDFMIPTIYFHFLILMLPPSLIIGTWMWRNRNQDAVDRELRRIAEKKLRRIPRRMPEKHQQIAA